MDVLGVGKGDDVPFKKMGCFFVKQCVCVNVKIRRKFSC